VDRRARIGVALQSLAYWLLFFQPFWRSRPDALRLGAEAIFIVLGCLLSSSALRNLGKQWRVDAGLNQDHELVRSGPYRIVRHPIYLSMLCMLIATGCALAPLTFLAASVLIFLVGTEIRVRIEDSLLASRFGQDFRGYTDAVSAYVPFIR
jgi:protein-S-isoprenylcysteine O-methyltransferase Ste14